MKIKDYQQIAYSLIENGKDKVKLYAEIDDINACKFTMPAALQNLSWIRNRKFVSVAPKIAIQGAVRTFATNAPSVRFYPVSGSDQDWAWADRMERMMEWLLDRINRQGPQSALWRIVEQASLYCAVAFQTEYLPQTLLGKVGPKYDEMRRRGPFNFVTHHPGTVFPTWTKGVLENVLLAYMRTVQDVIDEFGMTNPGVIKLMAKINSEQPRTNLRKMYVQFYDYTDTEHRCIWMTYAGVRQDFSNVLDDEAFVMLKEAHGMGFINWVIVDNKEPILKPLVEGEVWKNTNALNTIQQSMFIALAAHPRYWTNTPSGKGVQIDFDSGTNSADMKPGETMGVLPSPEIDPGLSAAVARMEQQIYESTAPRIISSAESLAEKGAAFSTINAIVQLSIAQLSLTQKTVEQALEEAIYQMFRWIEMSQIPLVARVSRFERGEEPGVILSAGQLPANAGPMEMAFQMENLFIDVKLQPQTLIDESGRINNAIQKYERLGVSQSTAMEEVGIQHPDHEQRMRAAEEMNGIVPGGGGNFFPGAQGINTAGGGISAQQSSPSRMGREQVSGKTKKGDDVSK